MKKLTIQWQRLLNDKKQTCPRCSDTGEAVRIGGLKLKNTLTELGIEVELVEKEIDLPEFSNNPLQSNSILINGKLLEEWVGGETGKSKCCDVCGSSECRTISYGENTFESIPENLIIKAGLLAAAQLIDK
ncbi:MAG: DUF2703 domain-containing protein [Halomonas sp.]|uniref:DUF2703 domain-containing protein n=1 Tax=Halomonas sp. TaxID=1486246 RepID=UPI00286FD684|nr:DUF2703 domain-containing protein [Halomonas sp.]MDR9439977.1 DUF2703 domain-containing protein [Halomonas sp.]